MCAVLALVLAACASGEHQEPRALDAGLTLPGTGSGSSHDGAARVDAQRLDSSRHDAGSADDLSECATLGGEVPARVADVVARINRLPEPASIACLIASLPRPLSLVATRSQFSAQPAAGPHSPRLFVLLGTLSLSVVGDGAGQHLLEFGEWVTPLRTLKAELAFPVLRPVRDDAPYHVLYMDRATTTCSFCHANEEPHPDIPSAFVSDALRPGPRQELPVSELRKIRNACDMPSGSQAQPHCTLLRAVFDYGEVRQGAFDSAVQEGF